MSPVQFWIKTASVISIFIVMFCFKAEQQNSFVSDVIGIEEKMLSANYWTQRLSDGDSEILTALQIAEENKQLFKVNRHMTDIMTYKKIMGSAEISDKILNISSQPASKRFYANGKEVTAADFTSYRQALNLNNLSNRQKIKFGIVVRRTNMRTFPTEDKLYKTSGNTNLDRFQETALFPTQAVAILHQSKDKTWFFVASYNYEAWVKKTDIAIGDLEQITNYKKSNHFLVVTGNKIFTTFNSDNKDVSELQLEMGTVLPLVKTENIPISIAGQNTYASHVVSLPIRDQSGKLVFQAALIPRSEDVHKGFLAYTRKNIVSQSFKFLGERYGWGHSYNARDCTGFIGEVFKSFGILMPRNSDQQADSEQGENSRLLNNFSKNKKLSAIKKLRAGDLIYIPGHVMMVLGFQKNKPYIIHDVSGLSYFKNNGEYYKSTLNGVSITPLLPLQLSPEKSYLDRIYNIKKIK